MAGIKRGSGPTPFPFMNGERSFRGKRWSEILVSPSRTYVFFVQDALNPAREHTYKISLPDDILDNDEIGAVTYFFATYDAAAAVTNVLTYELYAEVLLAGHFADPAESSYPAHIAKIHHMMDDLGYSISEIAAMLGISEKKVSTLLDQGKPKKRETMSKETPEEDRIREADVDNCLGSLPLPDLVALLGSEVETYLDKLPVEALAKLLHADIKAYLDNDQLLEKIKFTLANYYGKNAKDVKDEELLGMLDKLIAECMRYAAKVSNLKAIVKNW